VLIRNQHSLSFASMTSLEKQPVLLPQSGWHLDTEWANALQIEVKTFRDNIRKSGIPYGMFGNTMIVEAESFYSHLKSVTHNAEE